MSIFSTLAPAIAPAANVATQGSGSATRGGDGGTAQSSNAQSVLSSQAAVVSLSVEGKSRAASTGADARRVDAGYEKQEAKEGTASGGKEGKAAKGKIDTAA